MTLGERLDIMSTATLTATGNIVVDDIDFGNGRYSALMAECYKDAKAIFKLDNKQAESLARKIASDVGAAMAHASIEVKVGKTNKDGKLTLSEASKIKNLAQTYPILALRAMRYANEAMQHGFNRASTQWQASSNLQEYLNEL